MIVQRHYFKVRGGFEPFLACFQGHQTVAYYISFLAVRSAFRLLTSWRSIRTQPQAAKRQ